MGAFSVWHWVVMLPVITTLLLLIGAAIFYPARWIVRKLNSKSKPSQNEP